MIVYCWFIHFMHFYPSSDNCVWLNDCIGQYLTCSNIFISLWCLKIHRHHLTTWLRGWCSERGDWTAKTRAAKPGGFFGCLVVSWRWWSLHHLDLSIVMTNRFNTKYLSYWWRCSHLFSNAAFSDIDIIKRSNENNNLFFWSLVSGRIVLFWQV